MSSRVDHIGVMVADLDQTLEFLRDAFGLEVERELDYPRFRARFLAWGDVSIEVIELADADARAQKLGDAPAKIDHIAVEVDSLDAALEELRAREGRAEADEPMVLAGRRTAFVEADRANGVRYQLLESEDT
jgi:catechol 2,3-dioxygenase-like lactoylglutathione lyase family enzyme